MEALILVAIQQDYLVNGAISIPDSESVVAVANQLIARFDLVVATQNWHPPTHRCFAVNHDSRLPFDVIEDDNSVTMLWPVHCLQGSIGANLATNLDVQYIDQIFQMRTLADADSFSGLATLANTNEVQMHEYLQHKDITTLYVLGLPTDYCVKYTVLDALDQGYEVYLVVDGCRGINHYPTNSEQDVKEMEAAGVTVIASLDARPAC